MSTDLRTFLINRCGERALKARTTYAFDLLRSREREAVFDPYNRRIKLYGFGPDEFEGSCAEMMTGKGADPRLCSKVTVYALPGDDAEWEELGFCREGLIRGFFAGSVDAVLWAEYTDTERSMPARVDELESIIKTAREKKPVNPALPAGYSCQVAVERDAPEIAKLLGKTFKDYPSPTGVTAIAGLIRSGANHFRIIRDPEGVVVAAASAELDKKRASAEMTDCATAPEHRGKGLMASLLDELARDMPLSAGITDIYSLCRANEPGINFVLGKLGYRYTGTLVNNCRMPDGWESMNIWCKTLNEPS